MEKQEFNLTDKEGNKIDVPVEGSIGLLALGHVGLFAWRQKRKEENEKLQNQAKDEQEN